MTNLASRFEFASAPDSQGVLDYSGPSWEQSYQKVLDETVAPYGFVPKKENGRRFRQPSSPFKQRLTVSAAAAMESATAAAVEPATAAAVEPAAAAAVEPTTAAAVEPTTAAAVEPAATTAAESTAGEAASPSSIAGATARKAITTASVAHSTATISVATATISIARSAIVSAATVPVAASVIAAIPGPGAYKEAADKPARAVVTIRRASIWVIVVITPLTGRGVSISVIPIAAVAAIANSNADTHLGVSRGNHERCRNQ